MQLNVSEEIANYIHVEILAASSTLQDDGHLIETLPIVLMYNLDKERLEEALRKKLILRLLDQPRVNLNKERALSEALRDYFGGKFNHRL